MQDLTPATASEDARWGGLGTLAWGLVLAAIYVLASTFIYFAAVLHNYPFASPKMIDRLMLVTNGANLALSTSIATLLVLPLLLGVVKLKRGSKIARYLGFRPVSLRTVWRWLLLVCALSASYSGIKWVAGLQVIPEWGVVTYQSMGAPWLFFLGVIVLAPLIEELYLRGFVVAGLERTALRSIGAVLLTAAVWAVVHHQYHIYDQLWIFVFGLVLGASRVISGSVYPAIAIHVLNNLVAYLAVGLYLGEYPPAM